MLASNPVLSLRPQRLCGESSYPAFLMSTIAAVAKRHRAIRVAKKSMSRRSITPLEMASKWVRNEKEAMAFTTVCGAQPLKKSMTGGKPLIRNAKQRTTVTTKAMTWFLVMAETAEPI